MQIGIWGDSITYGEGDSEGLGWVGRIRKSFPLNDYTDVYNRGVCGDTSKDLLERFALEAESIKPEKIVIAIGINDSKYPAAQSINKVPIEKFKENIMELVEQAKTFTDKIFIVSATRVDEVFERNSGTRFVNEDIKKYNDFLAELSQKEHLIFIDVFDVLGTKDLYDGLHPNTEGYQKLFTSIAPVLM